MTAKVSGTLPKISRPASGSRAWPGEHAELHHQSQRIHDDAGLFDFAVPEPVDDGAPDLDGSAGGGDAEEPALVCAGPLEARQHLVVLSDLLPDRPVHIGEPGAHPAQDIFQALHARALAGEGGLLHHIFPKKLFGGIDIPPVQHFLDETADDPAVVMHVVIRRLKTGSQSFGSVSTEHASSGQLREKDCRRGRTLAKPA